MNSVSLRQLRYFEVLAEELHFGRAASRLYMAQPALSQAISALEAQLEVPLFNRTSRRVELTQAGEALLAHARVLLPRLDEVISDVRSIADGRRDLLRLGLIARGPNGAASRLIRTLETRFRRIRVEAHYVSWAAQTSALHQGDADALFALLPLDDPSIEVLPLIEEPRVVAVAPDHPLARRDQVSAAELADERPLSLRGASRAFERAWTPRSGATRAPAVDSLDDALERVAQGHAVHITPHSTAEISSRSDVVFIPITDGAPAVFALAWLRGNPSPTITALRELGREPGVLAPTADDAL